MKCGKAIDLSQLREHVQICGILWLFFSYISLAHAYSDPHTNAIGKEVALKVPHNHCPNDQYMCVHQIRMMMVLLKYLSLKRYLWFQECGYTRKQYL